MKGGDWTCGQHAGLSPQPILCRHLTTCFGSGSANKLDTGLDENVLRLGPHVDASAGGRWRSSC